MTTAPEPDLRISSATYMSKLHAGIIYIFVGI